MTGHQVYSTLHTNSSIGAMPRLMDLGVLPDIMAGNIIGVIAQRLRAQALRAVQGAVRARTPARASSCGMDADESRPVYQAVGCARCDNMGYRGRVAIMELFKLDAGDRRAHRAPRHRPRDPAHAAAQGLPHARRRRASRACCSARRASRRSRAWSTSPTA